MPRCKLLAESAKRTQRYKEQDDALRLQIGALKAAKQATWEELAALIGISPHTLRKGMKDPGIMRLSDLRRIEALLKEAGLPFSVTSGRESAS